MDKGLWISTMTNTSCPRWKCPACNAGFISLVPDKFEFFETNESKDARSDPDWETEWVLYTFSAWGRCESRDCSELFVISGTGGTELDKYRVGAEEYCDYFLPTYCSPMPDIIEIPNDCPKVVAGELRAAFALFWINPAASVGRMRASLEALLDYFEIDKLQRDGKRPLSLGGRIKKYKVFNEDIAGKLKALQWLGNTGAHLRGEPDIEKSLRFDLLDGFELFEGVLETLFRHDNSQRLNEIASSLDMKHGPKKREIS